MCPKDRVYEYIAVYVDDLAIAMADPQEFVDVLEKKHKFKLKGTGTIAFHLGCDFFMMTKVSCAWLQRNILKRR
jgi:hypothetical protein